MFPAHAIMFHHFCGGEHPRGQGAITEQQFVTILDRLGDTLLSADEWLSKFTKRTLKDDDVCLTFDDTLRCQYDIALPVLEDQGIKAFFFVYTGHLQGFLPRLEIYRYFRSTNFDSPKAFYKQFFVHLNELGFGEELERRTPQDWGYFPHFYSFEDRRFQVIRDRVLSTKEYQAVVDSMMGGLNKRDILNKVLMNDQHLKNLHKAGHIVGLHSHTHPLRMQSLSREDQLRQFSLNQMAIRRLTGSLPTTMSHPSNQYDKTTLGVLRSLGIQLGFRADMQEKKTSPLEIPRRDHMEILHSMGIQAVAERAVA